MCKKILKNIGFAVIVLLLSTPSLYAQAPHLLFSQTDAWIAGSSEGVISISFQYEHKFKIYPTGVVSSLGVSSGLIFANYSDADRFIRDGFFQIPLYFTLQTGHRSHHAHLSAGGRIFLLKDDFAPPFPIPILELSYRFEPLQGGIMLQGGMGIALLGIMASGGVGWAF
ncbi:MAG: hypothetical protein SF052_00220 [Bacteroidia bacterium]|nr:hypothetical protein [Bacteroidia bacterium]